MARRSLEQELAKQLVRLLTGRRGRKNGPKNLGGVLIILIVVALFSLLQERGVRLDGGGFGDSQTSAPNASTEDGTRTVPDVSNDFGSEPPRSTKDGTRAVPDVEYGFVSRCVDGDTLIVEFDDGATERVRLIGANTPETVKPNSPVEPFGPEASAFTKRRVEEAGGAVRLVADGDRRDRYGRRLAFVYLADSEISLNEELTRLGYARAQTRYRFSKEMKRRLTAAEEAARREGLGIHSL